MLAYSAVQKIAHLAKVVMKHPVSFQLQLLCNQLTLWYDNKCYNNSPPYPSCSTQAIKLQHKLWIKWQINKITRDGVWPPLWYLDNCSQFHISDSTYLCSSNYIPDGYVNLSFSYSISLMGSIGNIDSMSYIWSDPSVNRFVHVTEYLWLSL